MKRCWTLLPLVLFLIWPAGVAAQETDDETLSPYFYVPSEDPDLDALPLKHTAATVDIAGVIADVTVEQVYVNEGERPIEATYVFPASTRAAVYDMTMRIGARTLRAEVQEREEARAAYEEAKDEGRSASLLEQQRPNVFQMSVANVLPGDTIAVTLRYTEHLVPEEGTYEFVYPTVVGPRYANEPAATAPPEDQWVESPYLHEGEAPTYTFDLNATLAAGMPIQQVASPSHAVDVHFDDTTRATVALRPSEQDGGNRDFILRYRLAGEQVETGLLLHEGEDENFFLMMMQPPEQVAPEQVPPREYIFVVDVSGSMRGFPLEVSKALLRDLIAPLRPEDRFNVLLFAAGSQVWAERSQPATEANVERALHFIDRQRGGGGTELARALQRALALPGAEGYARSIVVATDGYVSFEAEAFDTIRERLGEANVFAFGVGTSVNRFLIEGMARVGMGAPFVATDRGEAEAMAARFRSYVSTPALTQVRARFEGFEAYDVEPPHLPDLFAERPVVLFGKWRGAPEGKIVVQGRNGTATFTEAMDVRRYAPRASHAALRYLWARHRIALLSDYQEARPDEATVQEVTDLGLAYNLLTPYTSFVAIDTRVRRDGDEVIAVNQPLPLPEGVPHTAVGQQRVVATGMRRGGTRGQVQLDASLDLGKPLETTEQERRDVFTAVEERPELIGGLDSLLQHIQYPEEARAAGVEGRVIVRFTVDERGRVVDPEVVRGLGYGLDEEALRVIRLARFRPATRGSKPIEAQMALPITFRLPEGGG